MSKILVIDDEVGILETLSAILEDEGHEVQAVSKYEPGLPFSNFDLLILDVWLKSQNGLDILNIVKNDHPSLPVLMISGHGNIEMAVDADKKGDYDFIEKPLRLERVITSIENALKMRVLNRQVIAARNLSLEREKFVGQTREITSLLEAIPRVAEGNKSVFISGESGSGKTLLAKHIYYHGNTRGNFVTIPLRILPSNMVIETIFGSKDAPGNGKLDSKTAVLFLQEISLLSAENASILFDALATGYYQPAAGKKKMAIPENVRIISSSRFTMNELVQEKNISEDLVMALSGFHFHIPALRERKDDIQELFSHFINRYSNELNRSALEFSPEAFIFLQNYPWPGNIRELENLVRKLTILSSNPQVDLETIKYFMSNESSTWQSPDSFTSLKEALKYFERSYILYAVQKNLGNITRAARELDIERTHLYRKLKKLGLQNVRTEVLEEIEQSIENK